MLRLKVGVVEGLLPRVNLTSYRNLQRAHEQLGLAARERDQALMAASRAAGERDRLAVQLSVARAQRSHALRDLAELRRAHREAVAEQARLEAELASVTRQRERLTALRSMLMARTVLPDVRHLLNSLYATEDDPNLRELWSVYDEAEARDLPYWDIRAAARAAARILQPRTYLEVGTRRGWSLAQVLAERPQAHGYIFELWTPGYGGTEQGSPSYIRDKMGEIVGRRHSPTLTFVDGDSHETLPRFFAGELGAAPAEFDLICIDGDHSRLGAWWDLTDLLPRVKVGGALLFDDLEYAGDEELGNRPESTHSRPAMPAYVASLMDIWQAVHLLYPNFTYLTSPSLRYRAGIAVRCA
jgi:predicted O-methyltransferase YrrM